LGHTNADLQQPALTHKRQGHSFSSPIRITVFKKLDLTIRSALIQSTITTFFNTQTLQPEIFRKQRSGALYTEPSEGDAHPFKWTS